MGKRKLEVYSDFVGYSDEDLIIIKDNLITLYKQIQEEWAEDLGKMWDDKFDQYSSSGQRKIKKLNKVYGGKLADVEIVFEELKEELKKREIYLTNLEDITDDVDEEEYGEDISEYEFVRKEQMKTDLYKQNLDYLEESEEDDDE